MPSSPRTPTRRRKSSTTSINLSFTSPSPQSNGYHPKKGSSSRRSSQYSTTSSPVTPRPLSSYGQVDRELANRYSNGIDLAESNGLGNLADELGEAFDEDEEEGGFGLSVGEIYGNGIEHDLQRPSKYENERVPPPLASSARERSLSPPKQPTRKSRHHRPNSEYDGSDYGDESDLEGVDGISAGLEARLAAIEGLARRGTEANGSDLDGVVKRTTDLLKDLGSQSGIENSTSRLITTHTALTSHLSNQTRTLSSLTHHIMSPFSGALDPAAVDQILPLLTNILLDIPTPTPQTLPSLHSLHSSTTELTTMLTYLSDTLQMTRQTTSLASRRLRSATEMVAEIRREAEAGEEAKRWIEKGDWDRRLAGRECARVCGDMMDGFEETCSKWRERLVGGLEVGA